MAIFCTKCGTSNEDGAGFCDNCGAKLRTPSVPVASANSEALLLQQNDISAASVQRTTSTFNSKKIAYASAVLVAVLVLGGGAMYFVLQPPSATASTLLAAAKKGYGKETTNRFKQELCISNIDYSQNTFNAGENDQQTQTWMNVLAKAGLYSPPVVISSGGLFPRNLLQYIATPELAKFRQGAKLCAAKDVEISEVTDIRKPQEQAFGRNGGPPKILVVDTKLLLKSLNTAPWMELPEIRAEVLSSTNSWEYKNKVLQKQIPDSFGLKDNQWTTGTAYKDEMEILYKNAQRGKSSGSDESGNATAKSSAGGFGSKLSSLFSFGHPLKGTWRTAEQNVAGMGVKIKAGLGPDLTFTSDSMESMGQSTSVDFSVDGKRVKVTPKGQSQSLIFTMEGPDLMVAQALEGMRYERVK